MNSNNSNNKSNAPDPELMAKLSDALAVLQKEIQEMLVNRLISTITSSDALKAHVDQVTQAQAKAQAAAATIPNVAIPSTTNSSTATTTAASSKPLSAATPIESNPEVLPLAAATLAALISQYSAAINSCNSKTAATAAAAANTTNGKSLSQVIPIHA